MYEIVNCYSGGSYADRPKSFIWLDEVHYVQKIIKTWTTPEGKHFKVLTAQDEIFELFYNINEKVWYVYSK